MKRKVALILTYLTIFNSTRVFANDKEQNLKTLDNNIIFYNENLQESINSENNLEQDKKYLVNISILTDSTNLLRTDNLLIEKIDNEYFLNLIINKTGNNISKIEFNGEVIQENYNNSNIISLNIKFEDLISEKELHIFNNDIEEIIKFNLDLETLKLYEGTYSIENGFYNVKNFSTLKKENNVYFIDKSTLTNIKGIEVAALNGQYFLNINLVDNIPLNLNISYKDKTGNYIEAEVEERNEQGNATKVKMPIYSLNNLIDFKYSYTIPSINLTHTWERTIFVDNYSFDKIREVTEEEFPKEDNDNVNNDNTNNDNNTDSNGNNNVNSGTGSSGSNVGSSNNSLDKYNLTEGTYTVNIDLWNQTENIESMGNEAIYGQAILEVIDGQYKLSFNTKPMTIGIYKAVLTDVLFLNSNGEYEKAEIVRNENSLGSESKLPSTFSFVLPKKGEEYYDIRILTKFEPYFPEHDDLKARLKINWSTLKKDNNATLVGNNSNNAEETIKEIYNEETKIKIEAENNQNLKDINLNVKVYEEDEEVLNKLLEFYDNAFRFLKYELEFTKNEEKANLEGVFSVNIPIPETYNLENTKLYRLNSDGSLTLITTQIENGSFVFKTSSLEKFIIVEDLGQLERAIYFYEGENQPLETLENDFLNHWAVNSILFMKEKGYLVGASENTFYPNKKVNIEVLVCALSRMEGIDLQRYKSNSEENENYYLPAFEWAREEGLLNNVNDVEIGREITREEAIIIINNYINNIKNIELKSSYDLKFNDEESINPEYKEIIYNFAKAEIIKGRENYIFSPKDILTRAELSVILEKMIKLYF